VIYIGVNSVLTSSNTLLCELAQMKFTVELDDCFAIGLWFGRCLRYSQQRIQIAVFLSRASVRAYRPEYRLGHLTKSERVFQQCIGNPRS